MTTYLTENQSLRLAKAIDNLKTIVAIFPECFLVIIFDKPCEIPFRKALIAKDFIVVYLYQQDKIYLIDLFSTAQDWKLKLLSDN
jgi:hypothetical protein